MRYPHLTPLLLALISSFTITTAIPLAGPNELSSRDLTLPTLPINSTLNPPPTPVEAAGEFTTCIPKGKPMMDKYRPVYTDCALALRKFPSSSETVPFVYKPSTTYDTAVMPDTRSHGNCVIKLSLIEGVQVEKSSWTEVGLAAMELLTGCYKDEKSAGQTRIGEKSNILLVISKDRDAN